jgi:Na+-driven multidrug efflux pump
MPPQVDPIVQAKRLRFLAMNMVVTGLMVGIGLPVLFIALGIEIAMTPLGFDIAWLAPIAFMVIDFALARLFWRRATMLEGSAAQGRTTLPP